MELHGYSYRITDTNGSVTSCDCRWFATRVEATEAFRRDLERRKWEPPRWWQWWRWGDFPRKWPE